MPRHSSIVRQFWDDMNRHQNARYRKADAYTVLELESHESRGRERLVGWVYTTTEGWGKLASAWDETGELEPLFRELSGTDRWEVQDRIKAHNDDNPRLSA